MKKIVILISILVVLISFPLEADDNIVLGTYSMDLTDSLKTKYLDFMKKTSFKGKISVKNSPSSEKKLIGKFTDDRYKYIADTYKEINDSHWITNQKVWRELPVSERKQASKNLEALRDARTDSLFNELDNVFEDILNDYVFIAGFPVSSFRKRKYPNLQTRLSFKQYSGDIETSGQILFSYDIQSKDFTIRDFTYELPELDTSKMISSDEAIDRYIRLVNIFDSNETLDRKDIKARIKHGSSWPYIANRSVFQWIVYGNHSAIISPTGYILGYTFNINNPSNQKSEQENIVRPDISDIDKFEVDFKNKHNFDGTIDYDDSGIVYTGRFKDIQVPQRPSIKEWDDILTKIYQRISLYSCNQDSLNFSRFKINKDGVEVSFNNQIKIECKFYYYKKHKKHTLVISDFSQKIIQPKEPVLTKNDAIKIYVDRVGNLFNRGLFKRTDLTKVGYDKSRKKIEILPASKRALPSLHSKLVTGSKVVDGIKIIRQYWQITGDRTIHIDAVTGEVFSLYDSMMY